MSETQRPRIGVGVYVRRDGKILMGKRKGTHVPDVWCAPGGHLEFGETWEECARREVREESGMEIQNVRLMTVTEDLYEDIGKHYITLDIVADWKSNEPALLEPDTCEGWQWFEWNALPEPLLLSTRNFLKTGYNPLNF